ncbi:MAG: biotin transporter BioY [Clostridia bacterium]|nr:biotin transporter BioY [Clostridia bacterium]
MNKRLKILCATAVFKALICVLSPLTLPTPLGVPITLQTLIIALTAFLLGVKAGFAAVICYVLIGAAGLPVFSGFAAGVGALLSPTGGFIFAFPVFAFLLSLVFYVNKIPYRILLGLSALLLLYIAGTVQFIIITGTKTAAAITGFMLYFVKDAAVVLAAYFLCVRIRPILKKFMQSK